VTKPQNGARRMFALKKCRSEKEAVDMARPIGKNKKSTLDS